MGELGWEIANWVPYLNYLTRSQGPFDKSIVWCRPGREGLYRRLNVEHFSPVTGYEDKTEGNAFVLHCPEGYDRYKAYCIEADEHASICSDAGIDVVKARLPTKYYRYHRFKLQHREFKVLTTTEDKLNQWEGTADCQTVIFHLRHISRSTKKNTPVHLYNAAAQWAKANKMSFITIGYTGEFEPKFKIHGLNLLNKTTLDDIIALYKLCGMVVGSSSGPMHLAAMTETPHVVWGGGRRDIKDRYIKDWNPFDTPVEFITTSFTFDNVKQLTSSLDKLSRRT